jgi:hypothetical protein
MNSISRNEDVYTFVKEFRGPPTPLQLCLPVLIGREPHPQYAESAESEDFHNPVVVPNRVSIFVQRWGRVVAMSPVLFLQQILESRGYETEFISPCTSDQRRYHVTH